MPQEVIQDRIRAAGVQHPMGKHAALALCGDHRQDDQAAIRVAAEKEEHEFYHQKAPQEWLDALAPLGTNQNKPFLELVITEVP